MMKSYLRYAPSHSFGAICSPASNVSFDVSGNLIFAAAVEDVNVWNSRQASKVTTLKASSSSYPYSLCGEVTCIERSSDKCTVAVGYSTGVIRIFNYISNTLVCTFKGHRSAISCLQYDVASGSTLLASGSKDTDVFIWDIIAQNGVCKLRGHKDVVTSVKFFTKGSQRLLVSSSKDTLLKVWDVATEYCVQTIVGHRSEVWCMALHATNDSFLLVTGSSDEQIRGYTLADSDSELVSDGEELLTYLGSVQRQFLTDKCVGLCFNEAGDVLAVQTSGKGVELYGVRDRSKARTKMKRRLKRVRDKSDKSAIASAGRDVDGVWQQSDTTAEDGDGEPREADVNPNAVVLSDVLEKRAIIRCVQRVRSAAFRDGSSTLLLALLNNTLELYRVPQSNSDSDTTEPSKTSVIELHGHRSDVRAVAVGSDGARLATCSADGVKVWNVESGSCLSTCASGYGVSLAFAPGGRYVLVGTKEGSIQVIDSSSGDMIAEETEAHKGAVWSLCLRPDNKGFASSSADSMVRFWDFTVVNGSLGMALSRELQMTHDAMAVRYSTSKAADKLLVAVGLLDNTIKVFFDDSLKFFLSLYGHKLPVMCLDISYDNTILISGSADKTVKIWGLDFGDCHRSLFAHTDSVTAVRFQPQTHYFFSCGKEGTLKYWDADRFEQVLMLPGHVSSIWGVDISFDGNFCVTVGADRTMRVWKRTEDLVFVEEERDRALEAQIDDEAEKTVPLVSASVVLTSTPTAESAAGGERLLNAIDLVERELLEAESGLVKGRSAKHANPQLLGKSPQKFMVLTLRQIASHDLEQALLMLPFHYARRFITILLELCRSGLDVELCCRSVVFVLRCHEPAILSTQSMLNDISALQQVMRTSLGNVRNLIGTNLAGLRFMNRVLTASTGSFGDKADLQQAVVASAPKKSKSNSKKRNRKGAA